MADPFDQQAWDAAVTRDDDVREFEEFSPAELARREERARILARLDAHPDVADAPDDRNL